MLIRHTPRPPIVFTGILAAAVTISSWSGAQEGPQDGTSEESATDPKEPDDAKEPASDQQSGNANDGDPEIGDESEELASDVAEDVEPQFHDKTEERAEQPGGSVIEDDDIRVVDPEVTRGAGMGSDTTYAEKGVVELGGLLGLNIRERLINFTIAPTVGFFFVDRFELSLIPTVRFIQTENDEGDKETNVAFAGILEPSYHLPITDFFYAFAGVGVGVTYEEGPGVDALLRPVLGADVLVGRSGIFKPQFFLDVGLSDGALGGGFQGAFTVMF